MEFLNNVGSELNSAIQKFTQKIMKKRQEQKQSVCAPYIVREQREINTCKKKRTCKRLAEAQLIKSVHPKSCLTVTALHDIVHAYNKSRPDKKIETGKRRKPAEIWEDLSSRMREEFGGDVPEHKWLNSDVIRSGMAAKKKTDLAKTHFRPEARPELKKIPTYWLETDDIERTIAQYLYKYPDFKFYGALPLNFDDKDDNGKCINSDICDFKLKDLIKQKYKYIGVVFNWGTQSRDGRQGGGAAHWVSLFVNIPKGTIGYMDSYGMPPMKYIYDFMVRIRIEGKALGIPLKIRINRKRHQFSETECGTYAVDSIIQQLEGKSFNEVSSKVVKDVKTNLKRNNMFSF